MGIAGDVAYTAFAMVIIAGSIVATSLVFQLAVASFGVIVGSLVSMATYVVVIGTIVRSMV